jgi:tRNA pseudouridine55 synthase
MDGLLLLDKPKGISSFLAAKKAAYYFHAKKFGYLGTLDPIATGLLPIFFGKATKSIKFYEKLDKEYLATAELGYATDTFDATGRIVINTEIVPEKSEIEKTLLNYRGKLRQKPPKFSAIKIKGRRMYELARNGIEFEVSERLIEIKNIEIVDFDFRSLLTIKVRCSAGTYIRSIINDLGRDLGCGATLVDLRRLKVGYFSIEDAVTLEKLKNGRLSEVCLRSVQIFENEQSSGDK